MNINLDKKTGINLKKGSSISLEKAGKLLEEVCIGLNWGAIQKKGGFLNLFKENINVDLDGSVSMFDKNGSALDTVYYKKLISSDQAISHSGDDRGGDIGGDDDKDNEILQINLKKVDPNIEQIVFYLNSFKEQDFAEIPYSKIRIFEGTKSEVKEVFATFNLSADTQFAGKISMIMGKLVRTRNNWTFQTIGEAIAAKNITETIREIQLKYLV
jgi:tellurium resistance protein TerZ